MLENTVDFYFKHFNLKEKLSQVSFTEKNVVVMFQQYK